MQTLVAERIIFLIDSRERGNKAAFGRTIGMSSQAVADFLGAKGGPSFTTLQKILKSYPDVSSDWLIFGEGEMLKGQQLDAPALTSGPATVAHAQELASNGLLREIIDTQKETILDLRGMVATLKEELGKFGGNLEAAWRQLAPVGPGGAAVALQA